MKDSLDTRYALALFTIAKEDNSVIKYQEEIKKIKQLFNNRELFSILKSEFINRNERYLLVDKIFKTYSNAVRNFIKILIKNHRLNAYQTIFATFNSLCNEERNVLEGIIYSTETLEEKKIIEIEKALSKKNKLKVELTNRIDPSLIGGVKVVINNHVYDYSIANEINSLRSELKIGGHSSYEN